MKNIKERLKERLKGKIVILGMGNPLRGDDGLGPYLIKRLKGRVRAHLIDGGSAPENYVGKITSLKPDTILVIDACDLGWTPGRMELIEIEAMKNIGHSTHSISPGVFMTYLREATGADIFMLAIQPKRVKLEEKISSSVKGAIEKIEGWLKENA